MMKRTRKLWMQMASVLCCLAFATSCSDDDLANIDNDVVIPDFTEKSTMDISEIEAGEIDSYSRSSYDCLHISLIHSPLMITCTSSLLYRHQLCLLPQATSLRFT